MSLHRTLINDARTSRRQVLRSAGVAIALPLLQGRVVSAAEGSRQDVDSTKPQRFIGICETLGFVAENFFPADSGPLTKLSPYLEPLAKYRDKLTLFSGVSHPDVVGGHAAERSFLSAAPEPNRPGFQNSISLDQVVAEQYGHLTRMPSLNLRTTSDDGRGMSVNRHGQTLPALEDPRDVFATMFFADGAADRRRILDRLRNKESIIDGVLDDAKRLRPRVAREDRPRLDEYFATLRDVENDLARSRSWAEKPKPRIDWKPPERKPNPSEIIRASRALFELSALAFQTDSTRSIALKMFGTGGSPDVPGVQASYHGLSHHGKDPEKLANLRIVEIEVMKTVAGFIDRLAAMNDSDGVSVLDRTSIVLGSNMGNASSHATDNLPVLLAGGGYRHEGHVALDRDNNTPLCNVYVTILQKMGIEVDQFASSTGTFDLA